MIKWDVVLHCVGLELLLLLQAITYGSQERIRRIVLGTQEKDDKITSGLFQPGANCDLFIEGQRITDNSQVVLARENSSYSLIYRKENVSAVSSLGEEVCAGTQARDVLADGEYSIEVRIVESSNHLSVRLSNIPKG